MGQEGQTVELFDFLYRDSGRITSYYAQLFGGRLSSLEETDKDRSGVDKSAKAGVLPFVGGEVKSASETETTSKRVIDPHELITTDVLSRLLNHGHVNKDPNQAGHGSLIIVKGTVVFVDRSMSAIAISALEMGIKDKKLFPGHDQKSLRAMKDFISRMVIPSAFLLQIPAGRQVVGTIKDDGMEEPISSYYFKHGTAGLSDVWLVAIKEDPSQSFTIPSTQLIGAAQGAAQAFSDLMFPMDAIRVTPIALFRKL